MYIYGNNNGCSVNNECESGYSLYFPCVKTLTRGENACFDFYVVDNATKEEVDLRNVDGITLNISGRYNCNFGSFSYPDYIKFLQVEKFSENVYDINFSDILKKVDLYIDIVDENHNLIESFLFDENKLVDIAIEGNIGYFLNGSYLNLKCFDTKHYMFLGWDIEEYYEECDSDNRYNFLINSRNITYNIVDDITIRVVYQKRREYNIQVASDNINSSFVVEYMGEKNTLHLGDHFTVLEGHDVKLSCIPNDEKPYKFVRWEDGFKEPYRILRVEGDNLLISLKAYCELSDNDVTYEDNIDASFLNNFYSIYPKNNESIFIDSYYIDNNVYINNCEICMNNDNPYIKILDNGYIQIINIDIIGYLNLSLDIEGGDCRLFLDNYEVLSLDSETNEFMFEFNGGFITLKGNDACIYGFNLSKEVIYDKGKCAICLSSDDTLKFHPGELVVEGGIIVNESPYGISPVKFAKVTDVAPLIIKNNYI
jgi:hypothetical protein